MIDEKEAMNEIFDSEKGIEIQNKFLFKSIDLLRKCALELIDTYDPAKKIPIVEQESLEGWKN